MRPQQNRSILGPWKTSVFEVVVYCGVVFRLHPFFVAKKYHGFFLGALCPSDLPPSKKRDTAKIHFYFLSSKNKTFSFVDQSHDQHFGSFDFFHWKGDQLCGWAWSLSLCYHWSWWFMGVHSSRNWPSTRCLYAWGSHWREVSCRSSICSALVYGEDWSNVGYARIHPHTYVCIYIYRTSCISCIIYCSSLSSYIIYNDTRTHRWTSIWCICFFIRICVRTYIHHIHMIYLQWKTYPYANT